jgi:hypothetical protein
MSPCGLRGPLRCAQAKLEWLPEFDAETIDAKYKGVSGETMTPAALEIEKAFVAFVRGQSDEA